MKRYLILYDNCSHEYYKALSKEQVRKLIKNNDNQRGTSRSIISITHVLDKVNGANKEENKEELRLLREQKKKVY